MPKSVDDLHVYRAVLNLFATCGYENTTTREMAAAAGIHEATLFRKYDSKARLLVAAMQHLLADAPLGRVAYTGDLHADLTAIVGAYVATAQQYGAVMTLLLVEVPRFPELRDALDIPIANLDRVAAIVQRYQEQGQLARELPQQAISALLGPLMVAQMFSRALPAAFLAQFDPAQYVDRYLQGRARGERVAGDGRRGESAESPHPVRTT